MKTQGKGKVYLKMNGGLGNQMFQWAFARMIHETTDMDVFLDMSFFSKPYARPYQLKIFNLEPLFLDDSFVEFKLDLIWKLRNFVNIAPLLGMKFYQEKTFEFDKSISKIEPNTYIEGFFQSDIYFKQFESQIRKDFMFVSPISKDNRELIAKMNNQNSIAIHIRRGDYVSKARYKNKYAHCSPEYYVKAVDYIAQKYPNPRVYVFSDDLKWAAQNIDLPYTCEYVGHNIGKASFEDMRLMSNCKHNVIANSTFSWWGAWLNENPEKIVVAPDKWFQDSSIIQTDIYPKNWVRLSN
ncbi:alpha-1,2-fucosyltransferase [bacterium]|nr:alpha-1,2-fucosyltransferase [bacterium]